jgi:hypothetical protein
MAPKTYSVQTLESGAPHAVDRARPNAEIHVLVGGPYTMAGEEHRYGHTAVRVVAPGLDQTYDFGRYGRVVGDLGAEGEGILRVWADFASYIAGENRLGRLTRGFVYSVLDSQARAVNAHFQALIRSAKARPDLSRNRASLSVYQLSRNYHALGYNCTTLSLDGVRAAIPNFESGAQAFIKPDDVLTFTERVAMKTVGGGTPSRLFLPANLEKFLLEKPAVKAVRVDDHGGKR